MKLIFHFLGSVHFAITLIGASALFIVAGTFIESKTGSHLFAAYYTYQHPAFLFLLCLFFINILFAALRRWPFKLNHIPFLITHLGLLMIIGGVIVKSIYGIQGNMTIMEGSGSHEILIPNTYSLRILKQNVSNPFAPLAANFELINGQSPFDDLQIETTEFAPHSTGHTETWIKGHHAVIAGLKPFKVYQLDKNFAPPFPVSAQTSIYPPPALPWNLIAFRTSHVSDLAKEAYLENLKITIKDSLTHQILFEGFLKNALDIPPVWDTGKADLQLNFEAAHLILDLQESSKGIHMGVRIPLTDSDALDPLPSSAPYLGRAPVAIELEQAPALIFAQDDELDTHLFAFDPHGRIYRESFPAKGLDSLIVYDGGRGGYYAQTSIPFTAGQEGGQKLEEAFLASLRQELERGSLNPDKLAPPLLFLLHACRKAKVDFATCCMDFLTYWDKSRSWLYPLDHPLPESLSEAAKHLDWLQESASIKKACLWLSQCFLEIDPLLQKGISPSEIADHIKWPLPYSESEDEDRLLSSITGQVFSAADLLPENNWLEKTSDENLEARALSAYFRAYGIHLSTIRPQNQPPPKEEWVHLECPITMRYVPIKSTQKLEDCKPLATLKLRNEGKTEFLTLSYDRTATGLYWPAFNGELLLRLQPRTQSIPYHVRLRNARQINYPHSMQPQSFESDLLVTHIPSHQIEEKTISMNNVLETWDGFRFYLAGLSPQDETGVKRIQLVVNYDPAKYGLTYPGGAVLSLGIVLLFWKRKRAA